jgi:hypothetical protein
MACTRKERPSTPATRQEARVPVSARGEQIGMTGYPASRIHAWPPAVSRICTFAACVLLLACTAVHAAIPASERATLMDLYDNTGGTGWLDATGWGGAPGSECSWYGIACDAGATTVESVQLEGNNLVGTLPADLDHLTNLRLLFLGNNVLSGQIPPLAGLQSLTDVALGTNFLSGSLPALVGLPDLVSLDCGNNELSGTIPPLDALTSLRRIDLSDNLFSGSIPPLDALGNLTVFNVGDNELSGEIPSLVQLKYLENFYVSGNRLTGPPPAVALPDPLLPAGSRLCPNYLSYVDSPQWDAATGVTPWYTNCLLDLIFADGFEATP